MLLGVAVSPNWVIAHISSDWQKLPGIFSKPRFARPVLVIESDDWGWCPGDPNQMLFVEKAFGSKFTEDGLLPVLETPDDMERMAQVLLKHKDSRNRPAVLTANMMLANIDFEATKQSGFKQLKLIDIDSNSAINPISKSLLKAYNRCMNLGVFKPQLHGLQHVNAIGWLRDLQNGNKLAMCFFDAKFPPSGYFNNNWKYNSVYVDFSTVPSTGIPYNVQLSDINDAVRVFKRIFGFLPLSTIAPFYIWDKTTEKAFSEMGVKYLQAGNMQVAKLDTHRRLTECYHGLGTRNEYGAIYLNRNIFFESNRAGSVPVRTVQKRICRAFSTYQPAVISSHRINFVGGSAYRHLAAMDETLTYLEKTYPDIFYMSSDELGEMLNKSDADILLTPHSPWAYIAAIKEIILCMPGFWLPLLFIGNCVAMSMLVSGIRHQSTNQKKISQEGQIRLAMVILGYEYGGQAVSTLNLIKHLPRWGIETTIFACCQGGLFDRIKKLGSNLILLNMPIPSLTQVRKKSGWKKRAWNWRLLLVGMWIIRATLKFYFAQRRKQFDAFYCSYAHPVLISGIVAKLRRVPLICHQRFPFSKSGAFWVERFVSNILITRYVTISNFVKQTMPESWQDKIEVIHNGIEEFERMASLNYFRERIGAEADSKLVGMAGTFLPIKGWDAFVSVANLAKGRGLKKMEFVAIGDKAERDTQDYVIHLKNSVIDNSVKFAGRIQQANRFFHELSVFLFCTRKPGEAFGLVLVEAMLSGVPVVAFANGAVCEIVEDGEMGILIPDGDVEAMLGACRKLCENPDLAQKMGQNGRKRALEKFSMDVCGQKFSECIRAVVKKRIKCI
jgi:glycosyltransferase involved in cell wall biosynthesis